MRIRLIIVNPCAIPGSHITSAVTDDMNSRHIIERAVFDLSFGSEEEAFQQQSDLSDFIKGRLMRVVDEVFGEMSTDGKVFRIDQLEIDLGTVAYNGFQDEMESRLRERLRNVLREKLLSVRSAPTPDERVITRERMELEQTEHFLTTGRMPWNVMLGEGRTVDQLLQQVVHSTGAELVEFLKTSPRRDTVVKRLVSQFPDAILAEIIRMLAPSHSGFLTSLVDDLRRICRKSGFVEAAEREFGRFVREQIIHELLETGEAFNPRDLVRRIMIRISQGQRGNYPRLLTTLAGESAQLEKEGGIGPELTGILQTLLRREAPPGDTESRSRALIHSYDLYETLRQRMIEGASPREDGDLTRIIDELARAYPWQLLRLYRELQADGRSIARMAASLSVEELGRLVEAFLSLTQQSEETEPSDLRRAMEAYASQAVDVKRYYGQILECLVMNQTIDFEAIIAERRPSDDAGDRDSDESVDGSVPERLTEPQEEDMLPPGEPAEEALARYLKEGGKVSPDDIARLVDMVEFMLAHQPGRLRRLLESSLDEREAAARLIQLLPERLLTRVVFLIRPSAYHRLQQCADILASACYSRELAVEPDRVRRMKWQYIFRYLLEEGLPYDEGAFARGLAGYLAEETKQADAKAFIALLSQQLALNILPSTREQHLAIVKALSQTTGEEALEVRSRTDEEDARSVSREMIRSYDLYEALRQRLIEGESFKEGGDLTRVMDELARAYPWQLLRLYRELQTRELTGVQTAAALSVGELSHLIRAFLTLPQQDGEDLSDLMSAIEAHAEQAADMKRYYGQVLECLLLNQVIDFEAIIAESQSSAEAGEEPEPPSVSLGELASYLREGGRISPDDATRLMDMVEFMLARQPGQFRRLLKASLDEREAAARIIEILPERLLTRVLFLLRPAEHHRVQQCADILASACYASGLAVETDRIRRMKWEYIFRYLLEEGLPYDEITFARGLAGYLAEETKQVDAKAFIAFLSQQLALNILPATREHHLAIVKALSPNTAETEGKKKLEEQNVVEQAAEGRVDERADESDDRTSTAADTDSISRSLIHSYDLYEALRQRLLQDILPGEGGEGDMTRIIDELARAYPWQLLRLYRELQARELTDVQAATVLSVEELSHLIRAFLTLPQQDGEDRSNLVSAIEAHAEQAADVKRYYGQVLECLLLNQVIDFEAIIAESQSSAEAGEEPEPPSVSPGELASYLKEGGKVSAHDTAQLIDMFELMLAHQPGRLRRLLESSFEEREAAARLIQLLPERMLTRVLFLLRPAEHHQVQQCADILASACYSRELAVEPDRVRRMKWQYVFRYMLEEGLPYEEGAFVRGFAGYLAEETKQADAKAFIAFLSQQLALNILPSTREQHLAILKALSQTTGEEPLELKSRAEEEDAKSLSRELIRSYDLYEALRQRLIEGTSPREDGGVRGRFSDIPGLEANDHWISEAEENNPLYPPFLRGNSDDGPLSKENSVVFPLVRGGSSDSDRLRHLLPGSSLEPTLDREGRDLTGVIHELATAYPWKLLRLYRELQADGRSRARMAASLSAEELGRLVEAFLSLTQQSEEAGPSELRRAMEAYASQAADVKRYYGRILECLVMDQVIDFEAIIAERRPSDDVGDRDSDEGAGESVRDEKPERLTVSQEEDALPPPGEPADEALAGYLKEGGKVSPDDTARLVDMVEFMLAHQPGRLRQLLESSLEEREAAARLIQLLPERLLTRVVFLIRPSAHHWLQQCADILASACYSRELAVEPDRIRQMKWQYIFRYLLEEGLPYDEGAFARGLAGYLAEETKQTDAKTFIALLSQQLALNILPATREQHLAIMKALSQTTGEEPLEIESRGDEEDERLSSAEDSESVSRELIHSYDLYEALRQRLIEGASPQEDGVVRDRFSNILGLEANDYWISAAEENNPLYPPFLRGNSDDGPLSKGNSAVFPLVRGNSAVFPLVRGNSVVFPLVRGDSSDRQRLHHLRPESSLRPTPGREGGDLTRVMDELASAYPWQLLRLYRELQARELTGVQAAAALSAEELSHLIRAFLTLPQQDGEDRSDLMSAIEAHAEQAADEKRYYGQVLECLLLNQIIDFEAIIAESQSSAEAVGKPEPSSGLLQEQTLLSLREAEEELAGYLKEGGKLSAADAARLIHTVEFMLARQSGRLRQLLKASLDEREAAARIIEILPERLLTRVLFLLRPAEHHRVQQCADILAHACYASQLAVEPDRIRRLKWQYIFRYLLEEGLPYDEVAFARGFAGYLAEETKQMDAKAFIALLSQQLALNILPSTREQHLAIMKALSQTTGEGPLIETVSQRAESSHEDRSLEEEEQVPAEDIYIANAGQVLAAPYLPRLFAMLDLTEGTAFKDRKAAERAVHLLQFMVNESTNSPEYQLVLNKILCGIGAGVPIERQIDITDREEEAVEGLIQGMIQNWKVIGNTSIAGLRESFLQREGRLQLKDDAWHLLVEPRPYDMLLDQIPWSFSIIKHPWMERIVHVEWR